MGSTTNYTCCVSITSSARGYPNDCLLPAAGPQKAHYGVQEMMVDPAIAANEYTYARLAATEWLTAHITSPFTGATRPHATLVPDVIIKSAIAHQRQLPQMRLDIRHVGGCFPSHVATI